MICKINEYKICVGLVGSQQHTIGKKMKVSGGLFLLIGVFFPCTFGLKQINVTIMVPGIKAFQNLVEEASQVLSEEMNISNNHTKVLNPEKSRDDEDANSSSLPFFYSSSLQYEDLDYNLTVDEAIDPDSDYSVDYVPFHTEEYFHYDESEKDEEPDFDRFLELHHHSYPWSYVFVRPALDVALNEINNKFAFLNGFKINLCYYDSGNELGRSSDR